MVLSSLSDSQLDIEGLHYLSQSRVHNFVHRCLGDLKEIIQKLNVLSERSQ